MSFFKPEKLDKEVLEKITMAGWFPGRRVDNSENFANVEEYGWKLFELAESFLNTMGSLPTSPFLGSTIVHFDSKYIQHLPGLAKHWYESQKEDFFPIGLCRYGYVYITSSGRVIVSDHEICYDIYGYSIYEGINNLINGKVVKYVKFDFSSFPLPDE